MKALLYLIGFVIVTVVIAVIVFSFRMLNNVSTPITVTEVEKGVKCASMVTSDGAALSCWKM